MDKKSRLLPQLGVCFLQKKAFEAHRKKINYIKNSLKSSQIKRQSNNRYHSPEGISRSKSGCPMSTIKQREENPSRTVKISATQRRKLQQYQKENYRLIKRIETWQKLVQAAHQHMIRNKEIKERLCKFKYDPSSKKTELKSAHSLQIMSRIKQREKDRPYTLSKQPENPSYSQHSKSCQTPTSNCKSDGSSLQLIQKHSLELFSKRNANKIRSHFGRDNFISRAKARLEEMRKGNATQIRSNKQSDVKSSFWKSRCFTTQVENYR